MKTIGFINSKVTLQNVANYLKSKYVEVAINIDVYEASFTINSAKEGAAVYMDIIFELNQEAASPYELTGKLHTKQTTNAHRVISEMVYEFGGYTHYSPCEEASAPFPINLGKFFAYDYNVYADWVEICNITNDKVKADEIYKLLEAKKSYAVVEDIKNTFNWLDIATTIDTDIASTGILIAEVKSELEKFLQASLAEDRFKMYTAVSNIFIRMCKIMKKHILSPLIYNKHLKATIASSFTKFCKTEDEAIETVKAYKKGIHPNRFGTKIAAYYTPTYNEDFFIVRAKADNTILESINFKNTAYFLS